MAISEKKMQIVMNNYFKAECTVNTSIREAFEKGFRIGVQKGYETAKPAKITLESAIDYLRSTGWLQEHDRILAESVEPERKWIPVSERLLEEDKEVLVTVHFDGTKDVPPNSYVEIAGQIDGYWVSDSDEYKVARSRHHVIAWKPLPEPWRDEK